MTHILILLLLSLAAPAEETVSAQANQTGGKLVLSLNDPDKRQFSEISGSCLKQGIYYSCEVWTVSFFHPSATIRIYSVDSFLHRTGHTQTDLCNASEINSLELANHRIGKTVQALGRQEGCFALLPGKLAASAFAWDMVNAFADYLNDPNAQHVFTQNQWMNARTAQRVQALHKIFKENTFLP